jgi:hypothetical protein
LPYNAFLSLKNNCHLNVEVAAGIKCVNYLFKYIYKGYDCADIKITTGSTDANSEMLHYNEINQWVNSRYVSAPEEVHRLFEFKMQNKSHVVMRLAMHLPFEQRVLFSPFDEEASLEKNCETTLIAWFQLNHRDERARKFTYVEIPNKFVWNKNSKGS